MAENVLFGEELTYLSLAELKEIIRHCRKCLLWKGARKAVPGEGRADAKVMLVGHNPGAEEDKTGRPFVGLSGRFLNTTLENKGILRESIFITNIVKHKTPGNRAPFKDEITACRVYISEELRLVGPEIVVLMGSLAWKEAPAVGGVKYLKTFHPAAAMRFPRMGKRFESDFEELRRMMR